MRNGDLNTLFAQVPGLKTRDGAEKRIERLSGILAAENVLAFPYQRASGSWIPVAVISERNEWVAGQLAANGLCVTRA